MVIARYEATSQQHGRHNTINKRPPLQGNRKCLPLHPPRTLRKPLRPLREPPRFVKTIKKFTLKPIHSWGEVFFSYLYPDNNNYDFKEPFLHYSHNTVTGLVTRLFLLQNQWTAHTHPARSRSNLHRFRPFQEE